MNGSAQKNSCNCYTLTQPVQTQSGSVWNSNKISLNNSFDFWFTVFLGCNDAGADGIVFILQPISTSVGSTGEGMGFGGVSPSIGIALDTYTNPNLNDPFFDHISIQSNGNINHTNDLAGPVAISSTNNNVEDSQWHKLRISWNAGTKWLRAYFDGVLRVEKQVDLVPVIFNNDPNVFWGFTGGTGGSVNLQQFCTALDPIFTANTTSNAGCVGAPVVFSNSSESFAPITSYNWIFGDGSFSNVANPPPHVYTSPGQYPVTLKVVGQDGCERDSTKIITIASDPFAVLQVADTCFQQEPRVNLTSNNGGVSKEWAIDGIAAAGNQTPSLLNLPVGSHQLQVKITSDYGCGSPAVASAVFDIKPLPVVTGSIVDACLNDTVMFSGTQTDAVTVIDQWTWSIGTQSFPTQDFVHLFTKAGTYPLTLTAKATNGCNSEAFQSTIKITEAWLTVNDTAVIRNRPTQLTASGNGSFSWSPATGLSNPFIGNPVAILAANQEYTITVTTPEGCTTVKTITVKVYDGPAVYVPSAFTPNGDGKNETLLPVYVGIKTLKKFAVFNRWGQAVFATNNMNRGWDGKMPAATYVWIIEAVDEKNNRIVIKGTTTIIK